MDYKTISEMFLNITNEFSSKSLYYYKKNSEWIGIKGNDVRSTVRNLASGLRNEGRADANQVGLWNAQRPQGTEERSIEQGMPRTTYV